MSKLTRREFVDLGRKAVAAALGAYTLSSMSGCFSGKNPLDDVVSVRIGDVREANVGFFPYTQKEREEAEKEVESFLLLI